MHTFFRLLTPAPSVLALLAIAGCSGDDTNPLLPAVDAGGDATATDAGPDSGSPGPDGGDASPSPADGGDASTLGDGGGEASAGDAAPPAKLSCTTWRYAAPLTLEDLSGEDASSGVFTGRLWVGEPASGLVRVISHPSTGPTFRVYGVDKSSSAISTLDAPASTAEATYESAHHFASVSGAPVTQVLVDAQTAFLTAYLLADSVPMTGPLPQAIQVSASGYAFAALPFANGDIFAAAAYQDLFVEPEISYALGVGLATPTAAADLAAVSYSAMDGNFLGIALAHENGSVYAFASNAEATGGVSSWVVPDTGTVTGTPTAGTFDTAMGARLIDVAAGTVAGTTNFAHASGGVGGAPLVILAGQVPSAQLATLTVADLLPVRTYTDLSLAPFSYGDAEWLGDDIMIISPGLAGEDGGQLAGANLIWFDASGNVRAEEVGASAVLQEEGTSITSIVASPASSTPTAASWDVAWVESRSTGDVLLYNELDCQ